LEVIEGTAVRLEDAVIETQGWQGEFPFFLVIEPADGSGNIGIDLDQPGWVDQNANAMRIAATWWLNMKDGRPLFAMVVEEGEQPYFTKHHTGNLMSGGEIISVGIGKKHRDGEMTRLWIMPNGVVCGGDDVDTIASRMLGG
jgi:hypothetical protein